MSANLTGRYVISSLSRLPSFYTARISCRVPQCHTRHENAHDSDRNHEDAGTRSRAHFCHTWIHAGVHRQ